MSAPPVAKRAVPSAREIESALAVLRPSGTILLVAIWPDPGADVTTEGATFDLPTHRAAAARWAAERNGKGLGLYWTVNVATPEATKKSSKADMRVAHYLWADVDPNIRQDVDYGMARGILRDHDLPALAESATFVVDSGNGLQAFWRLAEPLTLDADTTKECEAANLEIIDGFCPWAKGTHNIDRVMRLPGTWNYPSPAKLKKGYSPEPSLARLVDGPHDDRTYSIAQVRAVALRARLRRFLASNEKARARWAGDTTGLNDTSGSGLDMAMVAHMRRGGFTEAHTRWLLRDWPHGSANARSDDATYKRAIGRCWELAAKEQVARDALSMLRPWGDPQPVKKQEQPAPQFDAAKLLPEPLSTFVLDEADRMPCSPDYVAAALMVALGSLLGSRCAMKPKRNDTWLQTPNLFGAVVGDPSTKKSPAMDKGFMFFKPLEAEENDRFREAERVYDIEVSAYEIQKKATEAKLTAAVRAGQESEIANAKMAMVMLYPPEPPARRRYRVNDATIEKLGEILSKSQGGTCVIRDELTGLLSSWEREGHGDDRAFYLEGWNGKGSYVFDRIGRGTIPIKEMCLSVFGGIQPDILGRYLGDIVGLADNDGRLQRFQMMVYPERVAWRWVDRKPADGVADEVMGVFRRLAAFDPVQDGATAASDFVHIPHFSFDDEAQEIFIRWDHELHTEWIVNEQQPMLAEHWGKYEKLFCAIALILHLAEGRIGSVGKESALRAVEWCNYLAGHARRIYGLLDVTRVATAQALLRRLADRKLDDGFTVRDVRRKGWAGLSSPDEIDVALGILEEFGHVQGIEQEDHPGRPTTRWYVNPASRNRGAT